MAITRLGLSGTTRGLYGSFAGKAASGDPGGHNPGEITRLGLSGTTRGLYGSFAGRTAAIVEIGDRKSHTYDRFHDLHKERLLQEDEELLVLARMFLETIQ